MKALTICQPYAELIASGVKRVENRTWATLYRGPLVIHAGKSRRFMDDDDLAEYGIEHEGLVFGAVVAQVDLVACFSIRDIESGACATRFDWVDGHSYTEGPCCWVLENVRRVTPPVAATGQRGLWEWDG